MIKNKKTKKYLQSDNEYIFDAPKSFVFLAMFMVVINIGLFALIFVMNKATPIHSEKVYATAMLISMEVFFNIILAELLSRSFGYSMKMSKAGVTIRTGGITKIFSPETRYCFIPWKDIYAVMEISGSQLYFTGSSVFMGKNSYLYIIPNGRFTGLKKKFYTVPLYCFADDDQIELEEIIRKFKPEQMLEEFPGNLFEFKYVNSAYDMQAADVLKKIKRNTSFFNKRVAGLLLSILVFASLQLYKVHLERTHTYFYFDRNPKYVPEYAIKFNRPKTWERASYQDRTDVDSGDYTVAPTPGESVLGFSPETTVQIRTEKARLTDSHVCLREEYQNLPVGKWAEKIFSESGDPKDYTFIHKWKKTKSTVRKIDEHIALKRDRYFCLKTHRDVYSGQETIRDKVELITCLSYVCGKDDFTVIINTTDDKAYFTEPLEKDEKYNIMLKHHNETVGKTLDSMIIDKTSEL